METTEPTTIYITTQPTVKEQLVQTGVGLAASLAVTILTFATFAVAGAVYQRVQDRKAKKIQASDQ